MVRISFLILTAGLATVASGLENPKVQDAIDKMAALYELTALDVERFDREVESENFDLYSSLSYQRLLAARSIMEELEEQVGDSVKDESFPETLAEAQTKANPRALNDLKRDLKTQLASIQSSIQSSLIHLAATRGFRNINGNSFRNGTWALTYDDGPHSSRTKQILRLLRNYGYSATFFVLAQKAKMYPSIVRSILDNGMEVGNHSYSHPDMNRLDYDSLSRQIFSSSDIIKSITRRALRYFRLPYGSGQKNATIQKMLAQRGLTHVAWNVDSLDWANGNPQSIYNRVVKQMRNRGGGVILFHDIHAQTVRASELLMKEMRAGRISGRLMTVSKAL